MIVWSVVLPIVGTVAMLVLLGVGIARSRGLREVLLGIRGKGKVSLLNLFSVEGAGLVVILAIFVGGGIVYPLARAADLGKLEDLDKLRTENAELRSRAIVVWEVRGTVEVPGTPEIELTKQPVLVEVWPASVNPRRPSGSRVTFTIRVPSKLGAGNRIVPDAEWIEVQYSGYERLQIDITPEAFKNGVYSFDRKLTRLPPLPPATEIGLDAPLKPDTP